MSAKFSRLIRMRSKYSPTAFFTTQYDKMKNRVNSYGKNKYLGMELLNRDSFYTWASQQGSFYVLFKEWARKGFQLKYRPTVDRISPKLGYTENNIRWITHSENSTLGVTGRKRY